MQKEKKVDTPRYKAQRDNEWDQQIKSEQLYNALRKGSQVSQSNDPQHSTTSMSEKRDQSYYGSINNVDAVQIQDIQSQGPMVQEIKIQDQQSTLATMNSQLGQNYFQCPDTISISSTSSFEDPFMKAESQMDEALNTYRLKSIQLENMKGPHAQRQSRRQMREEIEALRFELKSAQEKLDHANSKQQQLEKLVQTQQIAQNYDVVLIGEKTPKSKPKMKTLNFEEVSIHIENQETDRTSNISTERSENKDKTVEKKTIEKSIEQDATKELKKIVEVEDQTSSEIGNKTGICNNMSNPIEEECQN